MYEKPSTENKLTKREVMASTLLAGLLAGRGGGLVHEEGFAEDARAAVLLADALLRELEK
jgi:hypothetical protein